MKTLKTLMILAFVSIFVSTLMSLRKPPVAEPDSPSSIDTLAADRKKHVDAVLASLKGKENKPADSVFKNVQLLKGFPSARMVMIMEGGFSKSLGVSCGHCHDTNDWASDAKPQKLVARDMWRMMGKINGELLKSIQHLKNPVVNCTTCHRGKLKPALNLE